MSTIEKDTRGLGTIDLLKVMILLLVILFVLAGVISESTAVKTIMPTLLLLVVISSGLFAGLIAIIRLLYDIKQQLISQKLEMNKQSD